MGGLDFVSPKAVIATSLLLKDPAQIYDDIADLATASNPNAMASVGQMEAGLKISLRNDLFARLTGELTMELDTLPPQDPVWRAVLKSKDPSGLLATLRTLLTAVRMNPAEYDEDGITYHTFAIPSSQKMLEITYAMVDNYLIVGSGREAVSAAVHLHRDGGSLAKSGKLAAALPSSPTGTDVSALFYEDPMAVASMALRNVSPELANSLVKSAMVDTPAMVMAGYGEETALREVNRSGGMDVGAALVVGAIAIPNLLRAKMAANDASAVSNLRTANTAQITYQATYPRRGYAHDLATLGPDPSGSHAISAQHASLIDSTLGCTDGSWCVKSGYRFVITTSCKVLPCGDYLVLATPVSSNTGTRNFCSTSDAVIRSDIGLPLNAPITAAKCRSWSPLQ
jgi:type IV pilus assembly protein PilA